MAVVTTIQDVRIQEAVGTNAPKMDQLTYQCKYFKWSISASAGWSNHDFSFPFDIYFLSASYINNSAINGDEAEFVVAQDYNLGQIRADVGSAATVIPVSDVQVANIDMGHEVTLDDGTNTDVLGIVKDYDDTAGAATITVATATTNAFTAATPTYIKRSVYIAKQIYFESSNRVDIGFSKIGGTLLPANAAARLRYKNNDAAAKDFLLFIEYMIKARK